jgi:ATP-binding cassette subfamily F protein uup
LKQYEGGYTDYSLKKQMDVLSAGGATGKGAGAAKISADGTVQASRTSGDDALTRGHARKLTYKEEKEWETIEEDISSIEERIEEIDQSMGRNTTDFVKLNQLSAEKEEMEAKLEEKMLRWEELSELVESINESK